MINQDQVFQVLYVFIIYISLHHSTFAPAKSKTNYYKELRKPYMF